ncbi:MAG: bifunctional 5,10-methylenetetrahydrofolate dehydrogenase/5,10-methenyltetrahydrofolate cyclohydrolase [Bdellovibrionota bacterium]
MPVLLKAAPVAEAIYSGVSKSAEAVKTQAGRPATLATVLVGDDPASQIYVRRKGEMSVKLGLGHQDFKFNSKISQKELLQTVQKLNADGKVDGILVQRPLPKHLNETEVFDLIDPAKDVDCFSPHNVGLLSQGRGTLLPCTPAGILEILKFYKIDVAGKNALVVGRSDIVGKPMALLLLHAHATVSVAHSKTKNLNEYVSQADIVVAAIGRSKFLGSNLSWKEGAVVVDVGMNRSADGKLCGDVDFEAVSSRVAAITPVPGGVGPMTIAMLMVNTVRAAVAREKIAAADC